MVSVYNRNAHNQGLAPDFMAATVGNLLDPAEPSPTQFSSPEWFNFDLAIVGLGFHHFEDPTLAAARLAERLKPGGVLMIIDFMSHENHGDVQAEGGVESGSGEGSSHRHVHGLFHAHDHGHEHGHEEEQGRNDHGSKSDQKTDGEDKYKETMKTIAHSGFSKDDIFVAFEKAGVGNDFAFDILKKDIVFRTNDRKITRQVFFARGTKA
jgi:SAM-dependent methyltransferase